MISNSNIEEILEKLQVQYDKRKKPIVTVISNRERNPFQVLISTILSLRTKDEVTTTASANLFKNASTPLEMIELSKIEIEKLIYPVGFYHRKATSIKQVCQILIDEYEGKVPDTMENLLSLPGVGRKTANLVLTLGFDKDGLCVDTHVHRISNRWGYVETNSPLKTEMALREKLPKEFWKTYNDFLVSYGQNICRPISPFCSKCTIKELCPGIGVKKNR